ncbi:MAG: hypothetical protein IH983_09540, partial [Planctomycetes bacterium]|nr:hypothetical protein [Planctomycetota bacterium]
LTLTGVVAGDQHTCARDAQGIVLCWGLNDSGQAGTGSGGNPLTATEVVGNLVFSQVVANGSFSCAITVTGLGYCWGSNALGQHAGASALLCTDVNEIGQITSQVGCAFEPVPMQHPDADGDGISDLRFETLTPGVNHVCGITNGGDTYCWGSGEVGELGDGQSGTSYLNLVPQRVLGQPGT